MPSLPAKRRRGARQRGQALVEFSLVGLIFFSLVIGISEVALLLNSINTISYASRDAAQLGAELGSTSGADCALKKRVEADINALADKARVRTLDVYWADKNGNVLAANSYSRNGARHDCTLPDGTIWHDDYFTQTASGYPESARCDVFSGTGCQPGHNSVDILGVKITYGYSWATPFPSLAGIGSSPPTIVESSTMRVEPVL